MALAANAVAVASAARAVHDRTAQAPPPCCESRAALGGMHGRYRAIAAYAVDAGNRRSSGPSVPAPTPVAASSTAPALPRNDRRV